MASTGVAALNALLQEMQALMGILPVAMVPVAPRVLPPEPGCPAHVVAGNAKHSDGQASTAALLQ